MPHNVWRILMAFASFSAAAVPALSEDERQRKEEQLRSMTTPMTEAVRNAGTQCFAEPGTAHPAEGQNLLPQ